MAHEQMNTLHCVVSIILGTGLLLYCVILNYMLSRPENVFLGSRQTVSSSLGRLEGQTEGRTDKLPRVVPAQN